MAIECAGYTGGRNSSINKLHSCLRSYLYLESPLDNISDDAFGFKALYK